MPGRGHRQRRDGRRHQRSLHEAQELRVWVKPGSSRGPLVEPGGSDTDVDLVVFVRERAIEGKANTAVERAVAARLGVPKSRVTVMRGHTARIKVLRVQR